MDKLKIEYVDISNIKPYSKNAKRHPKKQIEQIKKSIEDFGFNDPIAIAPNLDEMTAIKYRNIQQDAYIQGRAEEQQKAKQIIYENYIPIQKIKDKIEELKAQYKTALEENSTEAFILKCQITILQELLEERN